MQERFHFEGGGSTVIVFLLYVFLRFVSGLCFGCDVLCG